MIMGRFWEVDFSRGIAIILMIVFNWSYTLRYFNIFRISGGWLYWFAFPRFIGGLFIFIMGLSLVLNYNSLKDKKSVYSNNIRRGLKIFSLGLLITLVTWIFFPREFIIFGILHLIGISIILATPFLKSKRASLVLGIAIILVGLILQNFTFDFSWLLWLGFVPSNFVTFDYFPIIPWFGVSLLGVYFGNILYKNNKRNFKIPDLSRSIFVRGVNFLGRNSLIIYLLHQPLLLLVLFILGFPLY